MCRLATAASRAGERRPAAYSAACATETLGELPPCRRRGRSGRRWPALEGSVIGADEENF